MTTETIKKTARFKYEKLKNSIINKISNNDLAPGEKLPTIEQLAKDYNISLAPVRQAIQELDEEGYIVRYQGKGTFIRKKTRKYNNGATKEIAFAVPGIDENEMFAKMARKAQKRCKKKGYRAIIISSADFNNEAELVEELTQFGFAGAIISQPATKRTEQMLQKLILGKMPFVLLNHALPSIVATRVTTNDTQAAYLATNHLIQLGHKNIAIVSSTQTMGFHSEFTHPFYLGYMAALTESGITPKPSLFVHNKTVLHKPSDLITAGMVIGKQLIDTHPDVTAVISTPALGAGICKEILKAGWSIPDDISYVNIGSGSVYIVPLINLDVTAIDMRVEDVAEKAVDIIAEGTEVDHAFHLQLQPKLIIGKTTEVLNNLRTLGQRL